MARKILLTPKRTSKLRRHSPSISNESILLESIPDGSTRTEFPSEVDQMRHQSSNNDTMNYAQSMCGERAVTYTNAGIKMTSTQSTNYVRAVNDYSTSLHEQWSEHISQPHTHTVIVNAKGVGFKKVEAFIESVLAQIENIYTIANYSVDFHDDEEEELNSYSTYAQRVILGRASNKVQFFGIEALGALDSCYLTIFGTDSEIANCIAEEFKKQKKNFKEASPRKEKVFHTISSGRNGFSLEDLKLKSEYDASIITKNYNDDFETVDTVIKEAIHQNKKGLILLHGIPGSGKTSYIKHLITSPTERKIVYVPTYLTSAIASPSFISFVKEQLSNSVLVIEDAEQVLLNRENTESQKEAVSNILNMTDGILAEALNLLIICTFNTDMANLDKALLRKGRLLVRYHFDKLSKEKTNLMCQAMYGKTVDQEMSLADIYGLDYDLITPKEPKKVKFGFA